MGTSGTASTQSNGNAAMPNNAVAPAPAETTTAAPMQHHYTMRPLPENATPADYLKIAKEAIHHHEKMRADDALSHAETRLLDRSVVQSNADPVDHTPAVHDIEQARQALSSGDMHTASMDTDMAMRHLHMHHMMQSHSMSSNDMAPYSSVPASTGTSQ
jgi:hypothetical protein